jgi:hypothetical protein
MKGGEKDMTNLEELELELRSRDTSGMTEGQAMVIGNAIKCLDNLEITLGYRTNLLTGFLRDIAQVRSKAFQVFNSWLTNVQRELARIVELDEGLASMLKAYVEMGTYNPDLKLGIPIIDKVVIPYSINRYITSLKFSALAFSGYDLTPGNKRVRLDRWVTDLKATYAKLGKTIQ